MPKPASIASTIPGILGVKLAQNKVALMKNIPAKTTHLKRKDGP
ncbi:hypothetical protein [Chitinophaga costaii]|nr:hypothetical protein [Chitinophaga costaii]